MLSDAGTLSGTPTVPGQYELTVEVTDQAQPTMGLARASYGLRVRPLLRLAGPAILPDAPIGVAYTEALSATGGTSPYTYALEPGSQLHPGLSLTEGGTVSGTPSESGLRRFTVRVTDADVPRQSETRELELTVPPSWPLMLTLTTKSLPDGRVGTAYRYTVRAEGNTGAVTWTLTAGELPAGLTLDAPTGLIEGTPTEVRARTFTLSASDSLRTVQRSFTLTVH
jgi:hypothetical protein